MKKRLLTILVGLLLLPFWGATSLYGEEAVELALDPPDEALDAEIESELEDQDDRQRVLAGEEVDVPQIGDDAYEARVNQDQVRLLQYHRNLIESRRRAAVSGLNDPPNSFHLGLGATFPSQGRVHPNLDFQITLSNNFTFGPSLSYDDSSRTAGTVLTEPFAGGTVTDVLGVFALNYYSRRPYEGIWIQLGAGYELAHAGSGLSGAKIADTYPLIWNVGWRWLEDERHFFTAAFALGCRGYFFTPNTPEVLFTLKIQLGLAWNVFPH